MKKIFFVLCSIGLFVTATADSQPSNYTIRKMASDYLNSIFTDLSTPLAPDDIDRRYELFNILTEDMWTEKTIASAKNGDIYCFSLIGDDCGAVYLTVENDDASILRIEDVTAYKGILDFMVRNRYTMDQIDKCMLFIIERNKLDRSFTVH